MMATSTDQKPMREQQQQQQQSSSSSSSCGKKYDVDGGHGREDGVAVVSVKDNDASSSSLLSSNTATTSNSETTTASGSSSFSSSLSSSSSPYSAGVQQEHGVQEQQHKEDLDAAEEVETLRRQLSKLKLTGKRWKQEQDESRDQLTMIMLKLQRHLNDKLKWTNQSRGVGKTPCGTTHPTTLLLPPPTTILNMYIQHLKHCYHSNQQIVPSKQILQKEAHLLCVLHYTFCLLPHQRELLLLQQSKSENKEKKKSDDDIHSTETAEPDSTEDEEDSVKVETTGVAVQDYLKVQIQELHQKLLVESHDRLLDEITNLSNKNNQLYDEYEQTLKHQQVEISELRKQLNLGDDDENDMEKNKEDNNALVSHHNITSLVGDSLSSIQNNLSSISSISNFFSSHHHHHHSSSHSRHSHSHSNSESSSSASATTPGEPLSPMMISPPLPPHHTSSLKQSSATADNAPPTVTTTCLSPTSGSSSFSSSTNTTNDFPQQLPPLVAVAAGAGSSGINNIKKFSNQLKEGLLQHTSQFLKNDHHGGLFLMEESSDHNSTHDKDTATISNTTTTMKIMKKAMEVSDEGSEMMNLAPRHHDD